jgi:hypothetical protein
MIMVEKIYVVETWFRRHGREIECVPAPFGNIICENLGGDTADVYGIMSHTRNVRGCLVFGVVPVAKTFTPVASYDLLLEGYGNHRYLCTA